MKKDSAYIGKITGEAAITVPKSFEDQLLRIRLEKIEKMKLSLLNGDGPGNEEN